MELLGNRIGVEYFHCPFSRFIGILFSVRTMMKLLPQVLCLVFFISGTSALIFETIWFRLAGLFLGNSIWSTSIVLSTFMAGLAIGNGLAGRFSHKVRCPVRFYAFIEIVIAFSGLTVVLIFPKLFSIFFPLFSLLVDLGNPFLINVSRSIISFTAMLLPAVAMGATLPLLVKALYPRITNFGRVLGALYGWNTLGAMTGVLINELWIVEWVGISGAGIFAASLNFLAAALVMMTVSRGPEQNYPARISSSKLRFPGLRSIFRRPLTASFLTGFILLALEVIWFRLLLIFYNGHSWNFSVMLAVILAGISLGGLFASKWFHRDTNAHYYLFHLLLLNGVLVIILYGNLVSILSYFDYLEDDLFLSIVAVYLMFPVSFISGIIFIMLGKSLHLYKIPEGATVGFLTSANTTGAMAGALLAGFFLIPYFGVELAFFILAMFYGITAMIIQPIKQLLPPRNNDVFVYITFLIFIIAAVYFPFGHMQNFYLDLSAGSYLKSGGEKRVAFKEGISETIQYLQKDILGQPHYHRLVTNNYSMSGTGLSARRYMKLFVYLPVALMREPKNALLVCFGCGSTAKALTDTSTLKSIDIVDTSREILELSNIVFPDPKENPLYDPRVRTHIEDGRFFLKATEKKYDIITAEPPPPKFNGVVNLYSQEYFQLIYDRLTDGGITTYWLPVYQLRVPEAKAIIAGFCSVFNDCSLWSGAGLEWMIVGTKNRQERSLNDEFARQWHNPKVGNEMRSLGFLTPDQFGSLFIADGSRLLDWIADTLPLQDNFPQRLSAKSPESNKHVQEYLNFMNPATSRENFIKSEGVSRIWPEAYRRNAVNHFSDRLIINGMLDPMSGRYPRIINLHMSIHNKRLNNYIPWAFNSDSDAQKIIGSSQKKEGMNINEAAEMAKHLAGMAAQNGQYDKAEYYLAHEAKIRNTQTWENTLFRMYLLVLDGEKDEAAKVGQDYLGSNRGDSKQNAGKLSKIWKWLDSLPVKQGNESSSLD